jgi:DNA modification methylase
MDILLESGFDNNDLSDIWDSNMETEDDGFSEEEEIKKIDNIYVKSGDLFQLGNHRLICGNSTDSDIVKKLLNGEKTSFIYSDPPYNIGLDYDKGMSSKSKYGGKTDDNKSDSDYRNFIKKVVENGLTVSNQDLHIFFYCDQKYIGLIQSIYEELGISNQRVCLWVKNGFNVTPQVAFSKCYEPCIYGIKGKPFLSDIHNLSELMNKEIGTGNRTIDDILDIIDIWLAKRLPGQEYEHPTQKPATLHEKSLRRCTKINDIVLDLFGGSGSTLIACEQLKRKAYLVEIEPKFVQLIINRYEKLTGKKSKKIN